MQMTIDCNQEDYNTAGWLISIRFPASGTSTNDRFAAKSKEGEVAAAVCLRASFRS
jgi:hypothetical protein